MGLFVATKESLTNSRPQSIGFISTSRKVILSTSKEDSADKCHQDIQSPIWTPRNSIQRPRENLGSSALTPTMSRVIASRRDGRFSSLQDVQTPLPARELFHPATKSDSRIISSHANKRPDSSPAVETVEDSTVHGIQKPNASSRAVHTSGKYISWIVIASFGQWSSTAQHLESKEQKGRLRFTRSPIPELRWEICLICAPPGSLTEDLLSIIIPAWCSCDGVESERMAAMEHVQSFVFQNAKSNFSHAVGFGGPAKHFSGGYTQTKQQHTGYSGRP